MNTNILVAAATLSDQDLLAHLLVLAGRERQASAELVAHLAVLDSRPALYAAQGYGSLFGYCTQALRLSEDAACNRIEAARACRRFPEAIELLAAGTLTLTSLRLLARHLTVENHHDVLVRANHRSRREIEALVAELAPRPDVPSSVRRLPGSTATVRAPASRPPEGVTSAPSPPLDRMAPSAASVPTARRPMVQALAPERYRVQFTVGRETHEKLRRLQALLRREVPDGDPGVIVDRAPYVATREDRDVQARRGGQSAPSPANPSRDG